MSAPQATTPSPAAERAPTKVLYVMGAGRSGSTILGVTLGNCAGVFYAGELDKWLVRSGTPQIDDPERARFWDGVRDGVRDPSALFGGEVQQTFERSSVLFQPRRWRVRRRLRGGYRRVSEELYRAVARTSEAATVVDTSHYPLRAWELRALDGVDLYLLFLVREPQRVVSSLGRRDVAERRFGVLRANAYLWLTYVLSALVFLRQRRDRRLSLGMRISSAIRRRCSTDPRHGRLPRRTSPTCRPCGRGSRCRATA